MAPPSSSPPAANNDQAIPDTSSGKNLIAAIDLGSNSFHMVIAELLHGEIRILEKRGEKVQLAAGLQANKHLDDTSQQRALDCLERFAQRLTGMPQDAIWVVGTNALRIARNAKAFIRRAEKVIGNRISIISGREEARLIYLGVAHTLADDEDNRLVIDIGGGSTEFIIGRRFEAQELESLHMGCVSFRNRYFNDGRITKMNMARAVIDASLDLVSIRNRYRKLGWAQCVGSSGSIKAIANVLQEQGWTDGEITYAALLRLRDDIIGREKVGRLEELGVRKERQSVFPAGLAVLIAAFDVLKINSMTYSDGALREGLLYEMIGRNTHENVQHRTILGLQKRYLVDQEHATAVARTATMLWRQVGEAWNLADNENSQLLVWAGQLHEIGLAISHSQFHKHGAYLIRYSDLAGFTRQSQQALAVLLRFHRRKISEEIFSEYCLENTRNLKRLTVLLRLAVLLQRPRNYAVTENLQAAATKKSIQLQFPKGWLKAHSLVAADLESEQNYLTKFGFTLTFS